MGPVRSLYEQQGGLERAVMQQPSGGGPVMLRPVDMSDCGKKIPRCPCRTSIRRRNAPGVRFSCFFPLSFEESIKRQKAS